MSARTTYEIEAALLRSLSDEVERWADTEPGIDSLRAQLREQEDRVARCATDLEP